MSASPPRLAQWLIERSLPADRQERDAVLGDLAEEHAALETTRGPRAADAWYWRQTARSLAPNLRRRLSRPNRAPASAYRGGPMTTVTQDLRYGARMLWRRPAVTAIALASLAIGIALASLVFTLLDSVVFRPLAIAEPDRLAIVLEQRPASINHNFSYPDFVDYRSAQRSFSDLAAYSPSTVTLRGGSASRVLDAELVSGSYFSTLGVRMASGRPLTEADDRSGAQPTVVVAEPLWREIAGTAPFEPRTVVLNGREFGVSGVVSRDFRGMEVGRDVRVWIPLHDQALIDTRFGDMLPLRTTSWLTIAGRLRPFTTREQAAADLARVDAAFAGQVGRPARTFIVAPGRQGDSMLPETTGGPLALLFGAAVLVLLVACANVANLLLARASEREREIAVRAALGAGRWRLTRLVLVETLLLSLGGAAAGAVAARWSAGVAAGFIARFGEPAALDVALDWRTIGFVALLVVLTTLLTGAGPVLAVLRPGRSPSLGDSGRAVSAGPARARTQRALVVAQFALSLALVAAALLLTTTVRNLRSIPTGFDVDHVALLSVDPSVAPLDGAQTRAYIDSALARLARVPGVRAAGFGRVIPLGFGGSRTTIAVPGYRPAPDEGMEINFNVVSGSYFDATGIAIVEGRAFAATDTPDSAPVAIVNETMAQRYWGGVGALGRQISLGDELPLLRVVGVARDVKYRRLRETRGPSFYLAFTQAPARSGVFHVRVNGSARALLDTLRRATLGVDASVPITAARTLRAQIDLNLNDERLAMLIGVTLGAAALVLAAVGLFGSLAYMVGQRTRELGVRMAVGATAGDVNRLVLRQGVTMSLAGTALGATLALGLGLDVREPAVRRPRRGRADARGGRRGAGGHGPRCELAARATRRAGGPRGCASR